MKKQLIVAIVLVLMMFGVVTTIAAQGDPDLEPYTWEAIGFTIGVPADWEGDIVEDESTLSILSAENSEDFNGSGLVVAYFTPDQTAALGTLADGTTDFDVALSITEQLLTGLVEGEEIGEVREIETSIGTWPFYIQETEDNTQLYTVVILGESAFLIGLGSDEFEDLTELQNLFVQIVSTATLDAAVAVDDTDTDTAVTISPPDEPIVLYTETFNDAITESSTSIPFTFEARAGDVATITMIAGTDGSLDPTLELYTPDGLLLARNDDAIGFDSQIQNQLLPANGEYTVQATRFNGTGPFMLTIEVVEANYVELAYGDTVVSNISIDTEAVLYEFEGSAGDAISISMVSIDDTATLDPLLILTDSKGNQLDDDDDGGGSFNSLLEYVLPTDGTYIIQATRYSGDGDYELTLTLAGEEPAGNDIPVTAPDGSVIIDQFEQEVTVPGEFTGIFTDELPEHVLNFEAEAGQTLTVEFRAGEGISINQFFVQVTGAADFQESIDTDNNTISITATLDDSGFYNVYVLSTAFEADRYSMTLLLD